MTNASTEAIAGALMPTELLTARSSSNERTYLEEKKKKEKKRVSALQYIRSKNEINTLNLASSIHRYLLQERHLPRKEFNDFHATQDFL